MKKNNEKLISETIALAIIFIPIGLALLVFGIFLLIIAIGNVLGIIGSIVFIVCSLIILGIGIWGLFLKYTFTDDRIYEKHFGRHKIFTWKEVKLEYYYAKRHMLRFIKDKNANLSFTLLMTKKLIKIIRSYAPKHINEKLDIILYNLEIVLK